MNYFEEVKKELYKFESLGLETSLNGTILIGKAPHIAEFAWLNSIYRVLNIEDIVQLEKELETNIPSDYKSFLLNNSNGLKMFVSIFSLDGMRKELGRTIEASRQPYSILTPNIFEKPAVKFYYNERGHRIKKESFVPNSPTLSSTTYYVLDLAGNVMSNYYKPNNLPTITQTELPIFGISRIGVYVKGFNDYANYQITDHLGNVRAVLKKVFGGAVSVNSYADYYPFGEQLPSRSIVSSPPYKYTFQGQELDTETNMEAFQLRLWDARLGRWLSPDPYGQYASPYLGMGNNPVSRIDPDGGLDYPERDGYGCGDRWSDADGTWLWDSDFNVWLNQDGVSPTFLSQVVIGKVEPMISAYEPNSFGKIENSLQNGNPIVTFIPKIVYGMADDAFVIVTRNTSKSTTGRHLNRDVADPKEVINAGLNTLYLITPSPIKGMPSKKIFSSVPTPSLINKFNVSTFGSTFKGTFLTRLAPATRGSVIVTTNKALTFFTSRSMFTTYTKVGAKKVEKKINE